MLEHCVRNVLNRDALRRFAVLRPLKLVIENYPEGQVEELDAVNNPEDAAAGTRTVRFSREIWIEREDFMEDPPKKFFRLAPGREVRLRYAYFVTCREVVKDAQRGDRRAALHVRPGDARRRRAGRPAPEGDAALGLRRGRAARGGPALRPPLRSSRPGRRRRPAGRHQPEVGGGPARAAWSSRRSRRCRSAQTVQFERLGYFCPDPDSRPGRPVFNRTLTLKDTWAEAADAGKAGRVAGAGSRPSAVVTGPATRRAAAAA